ncbi:MAG: DUF3987 domain-containing protein [Candidatus Aenigmatarchaeota archaeon]
MQLTNNDYFEIQELNSNKSDEILFDYNQLSDSNIKKMLIYYDKASSSPPEYLLTVLLTALSGAVGKNVYWEISHWKRIYLNIWAVIIGPSSITKKSSAIELIMKDLYLIDSKWKKEFQKEYANYKEKERNKKNKNAFIEPPPQRKYLVIPNDVTIEKLGIILTHSEKGIIVHSEFGGFLAKLEKSYSGDAKQIYTKLYDVERTSEIARISREDIILEYPYFAMIGASTPEWISLYSSEYDLFSGFFARFLFSFRNSNNKFRSLFDLNNNVSKENYFNTSDVFEFLTQIKGENVLNIEKSAESLFREKEKEYYQEINKIIKMGNNASLKARLITYILKIAGLIALADKRFNVTESDMKNAIIISDYYNRCIDKLLNTNLFTKNKFAMKEERILKIIKESGKISRTQLMQMRIAYDKNEFDKIIDNLYEKELIDIKIDKKKGFRASTYYTPKFNHQ